MSRRAGGVDEAVLARARRSDPDAVGQLYETFRETLYQSALRVVGEPQDAEEVVQDLFLALPKKLATFESRGSLEGWLRRITVRMALAQLADQERRETVHRAAAFPTQLEVTGSIAARIDLWRALPKLPPPQRRVFLLREVEGYSHAEVAERLGITVSNSMVLLHRARTGLRIMLGGGAMSTLVVDPGRSRL